MRGYSFFISLRRLQWGRSLEGAESRLLVHVWIYTRSASMGPLLGRSGKGSISLESERDMALLQWGRSLEGAESKQK